MTKRDDIRKMVHEIFDYYPYARRYTKATRVMISSVYKSMIRIYMMGVDDGIEAYQNHIDKMREKLEERTKQ